MIKKILLPTLIISLLFALTTSRTNAYMDTYSGSVEMSEGVNEEMISSLPNLAQWLSENESERTSGLVMLYNLKGQIILQLIEDLGADDYSNLKANVESFCPDGIRYHSGGTGDSKTCESFFSSIEYFSTKRCTTPLTGSDSFLLPTASYVICVNDDIINENETRNEAANLGNWLQENNQASLLGLLNEGRDTGGRQFTIEGEGCELTCSQTDEYDYIFQYETQQGGSWIPWSSTEVHKCEDMRLAFNPVAEWFGSLSQQCGPQVIQYDVQFPSPPTSFITCADQENCLALTTEYELTPETWGKGMQQVPANWVDNTNQSFTGSDQYLNCANGICEAHSSGDYAFSATAAESTYYGQCRGYGLTIIPDGVNVPAVTSNVTASVINQPPSATVAFSQSEIDINEEVTATCNVTDPDCADDPAHQDHIVRYKWNCYDSQYQPVNCHMKGIDDVWRDTEYITEGDFGNPAAQTVGFRVDELGGYYITCEAWDNDPRNPRSSRDSDPNGKVAEATIGVIPAIAKFCNIFSEEGSNSKTECNTTAKTSYRAYFPSYMSPSNYRWCCNGTSDCTETTSSTHECEYGAEGTYTPTLILTDDGSDIQCTNNASFKLTQDETCTVEARKEGDDNWSTSLNISTTDTVEARVVKQCMEGNTSWSVSGGTEQSSSDDNLRAVFQRGEGSISATVGEVNCGTVNISTSETVRWGI